MVDGTLLNFGKTYKDDLTGNPILPAMGWINPYTVITWDRPVGIGLRVIFAQWQKLHLGLDALSNQKS